MQIPDPAAQVCVILLQLGGPKDADAIEPFLHNLFEDVLPLPKLLRRPLAGFIARRRTPKVRPLYAEIGGGSPLLPNTQAQQAALRQRLADLGVKAEVVIGMRYAPPRIDEALRTARACAPTVPWVALSLYPQYSYATSRSSLRELQEHLLPGESQRVRAICAYPQNSLYLDAMAQQVDASLAALPAESQKQVHLVFSAHGLPLKLVREGDPYPQHISKTVDGVMQRLKNKPRRWTLCYQSRVGPVKWLTPSTMNTLEELGQAGEKHVVVVPVAFTSEHIETLHEIDIELRDVAHAAGIQTYVRVPTVGTQPQFIDGLAQMVIKQMQAPQMCCGVYPECELRSVGQQKSA
jgi:ferrochelatase